MKLLDLLFIALRVDQPRVGGLPFLRRAAAARAVRETASRLLDDVHSVRTRSHQQCSADERSGDSSRLRSGGLRRDRHAPAGRHLRRSADCDAVIVVVSERPPFGYYVFGGLDQFLGIY
jgi:hypothetical protein